MTSNAPRFVPPAQQVSPLVNLRLSSLLAIALLAPFAHAEPVSFKRDIAPLLQSQCLTCHGPRKAQGGYRVDTFEHATAEGDSGAHGFVAKDPEGSESFRRLVSTDKAERMPKDGKPFSAEQIALVKRWIEEGANYDGGDPKSPLVVIIPPPVHPAAPETYRAAMPIMALAFSPDGKELLAGGYHELTVWNPIDGKLMRRIGNVAQRTYGLSFKPDGSQLAVACGTPGALGEVRIFKPDGELLKVVTIGGDVVFDAAWSAQGDRLAVASSDGTIRILETESFTEQQVLSSHSDWVYAVAWSPDGKHLASGSRDKTAKAFDIASGKLLSSYLEHNNSVRGVLFHPQGKEVFSSGSDSKVRRWKTENAQRTGETNLGGDVYKIIPQGEFFFVASSDNRVRQFKTADMNKVREFSGKGEGFLSTAAHLDSQRVAGGGFDGGIVVWQLNDGKEVVAFPAVPGKP